MAGQGKIIRIQSIQSVSILAWTLILKIIYSDFEILDTATISLWICLNHSH